jgi:hypothetical protein
MLLPLSLKRFLNKLIFLNKTMTLKPNWYLLKFETDNILIKSRKKECAIFHLENTFKIDSPNLEEVAEVELKKYFNDFKPDVTSNLILIDKIKQRLFYGNINECKCKQLNSIKELKYGLESRHFYEKENVFNSKIEYITERKYKRKQ